MPKDGVLIWEQRITRFTVIGIEIPVAVERNREVAAELSAVTVAGTVDNHGGQRMPEGAEALAIPSLHAEPGFFLQAPFAPQAIAPTVDLNIVVGGQIRLDQERRVRCDGNFGVPRAQQIQ